MPLKHFIADDKSIAKAFVDYIEYIYGGNCMIDDQDEEGAHFSMNVPGSLKREDFENDVQDFCEEHNCSFELVNQTPEAPSPQFFSENMKLMYPRAKNYEALAKNPQKLEKAKILFKQSWDQDFNEEDEDDKEDLVLLWNEYMEELSEWKPVEVKLHYNQNLKEDSDSEGNKLAELRAACKQIEEDHNYNHHYDARSEESQKYHVKQAIKNLKELTGLDFKVIHFEEEYGGRDEEGSWYYPTYTLESTNDGTKYQMNLCFSGGYKQAINFEDFKIKEPELKEDSDKTWVIMYEYTDDEKTFKEHLGERDFDYIGANSKDEAIETFKKHVKEGLVHPRGKYLRIMRVGDISGKTLREVSWIIHNEIINGLKEDSEDPERYAIILNGEWYKTVNSYQKAMEEQEKLQSTDDEDFVREYGPFPSVEIKPIKDEPIFLMNGKLVKADNHREIKENKNFPEIRGNKSEVEQKCKEYQDIWNIDRTDGYIWILKPVMVGSENR